MNLEKTKIPDFTLKNQDDVSVSIKDLLGKKVIIYFYPKDGTPGCTMEAKEFRDLMPEFDKLNTVVLGISKDNAESHCNFRDKYELNFQLLSDPDLVVAKLLQANRDGFSLTKLLTGIIRSTLVINEDGMIIKHYETIDNAAKHPQELLDFIKSC